MTANQTELTAETSCCDHPRIWYVRDLAAYTYGGPIYTGAAYCRSCKTFFGKPFVPKPGDGEVTYQ